MRCQSECVPMSEQKVFERFRDNFNFGNYEDRSEVFVQCVVEAIQQHGDAPTVLDIGCGRGIRRQRQAQRLIGEHAGTFWAVEPDVDIEIERDLFAQCWRNSLEEAPIPPGSVDVAYAHMVVEHVADPLRFVRKLAEILKPGGCAVFLTINARSYMARIARAAGALRLQDFLLRLGRGRQAVEEYHYPAIYRFNTASKVTALAQRAGFSRAEFAFLDKGEAGIYFPRALRWIGQCLDYKHRRLRQRELLLLLLIVLRK